MTSEKWLRVNIAQTIMSNRVGRDEAAIFFENGSDAMQEAMLSVADCRSASDLFRKAAQGHLTSDFIFQVIGLCLVRK